MLQRTVCPGESDPVTYADPDIISRASRAVDEIVTGVRTDPAKQTFFTADEREEMIRSSTCGIGNVTVAGFFGSAAEFARDIVCPLIIRGILSRTDPESGMQAVHAGRVIGPVTDTMFSAPSPGYAYPGSSVIMRTALCGGDAGGFVPPAAAFERKMKELKKDKEGGNRSGRQDRDSRGLPDGSGKYGRKPQRHPG